jgi:hypothetical protein
MNRLQNIWIVAEGLLAEYSPFAKMIFYSLVFLELKKGRITPC